jgi:hypothetical protein
MSNLYSSGTSGELRSSNPAAVQDADLGVLISPYNYSNGVVLEFDQEEIKGKNYVCCEWKQ